MFELDYYNIEYFLRVYLDQLKTEYEVPNIRFEFDNDAFDFFKYLMEKHHLNQEYYDYLISNPEEDCLNIKVHNYELFFNLIIRIHHCRSGRKPRPYDHRAVRRLFHRL